MWWMRVQLCVAVAQACTCAARGQDLDTAVAEIRQLLRDEGTDRILFPEGPFDPVSFDPEAFDPLMLEAAWEHVRPSVRGILEKRLNVELIPESPRLLVGRVSRRGGVGPGRFRRVWGARRGASSTRYQIMFIENDPLVRTTLMRALSLPEQCFPNWHAVRDTRPIRRGDLTVPWEDIGIETSRFVSASAKVREQGFAVQAPIDLGDKKQLVTSWKKYREIGSYEMYWRLFFQVKRGASQGSVDVTVRGQVGRKLRSEPIERIEYLGTEETDSKYEVPLGEVSCPATVKYEPNDSHASGPTPEEPGKASRSGQLAHQLLEEYIAFLTQ